MSNMVPNPREDLINILKNTLKWQVDQVKLGPLPRRRKRREISCHQRRREIFGPWRRKRRKMFGEGEYLVSGWEEQFGTKKANGQFGTKIRKYTIWHRTIWHQTFDVIQLNIIEHFCQRIARRLSFVLFVYPVWHRNEELIFLLILFCRQFENKTFDMIWLNIIERLWAHTWYLSQTPQTCLCKKKLPGVNFYRFNAKYWRFPV